MSTDKKILLDTVKEYSGHTTIHGLNYIFASFLTFPDRIFWLVIFLFGIVAVLYFGDNDPAHFGKLERAMLSLFQCATLSGWGEMFLVNFYGCDKYTAELYVPTTERIGVETEYGYFETWGCDRPDRRAPVGVTVAFFVVYTVLTAFVILSLFISVITMSMFEIMQLNRHERARELNLQDLSPEQKRERMREYLTAGKDGGKPGTGLAIHDLFELVDGSALDDQAHDSALAKLRASAVRSARHIAAHSAFTAVIVGAIFVVGGLEALVTNGHGAPWIRKTNLGILCLFSFEVIVKLVAEDKNPGRYFKDNWNKFDSTIVFISWLGMIVPLGSTSFLRLLRLMRVVKLLHSFPALRSVTQSLLNAFENVGYVVLMIMIINFVFAAIGMIFFRKNDPQNFGTFASSMMTIWRIETLDGWEDIMYTNVVGCDQFGYSVVQATRVNTTLTEYPPYMPAGWGEIPMYTTARACDEMHGVSSSGGKNPDAEKAGHTHTHHSHEPPSRSARLLAFSAYGAGVFVILMSNLAPHAD